ncbi:MAG: N-acetylmuramoyl-L-alanine amidase, partial [Candidatus Hydrogenedens sp.]
LQYGKDSLGEYATYKLQAGETIYSVIVRYTDYTEHADILRACEIVKKWNNIRNERMVKPGTSIKIPLDMLSDIYLPTGKEERRVADEVKKEVEQIKRTKKTAETTNALKGVVVIIDPGHGGKDHGAPREVEKIYEDEVNYDIACRLKEYLEQKTQARVYMTIRDESQNYTPSTNKRFINDKDEYVLVTPPHNPQDSVCSTHLRWLLANSIVRKEEKTKISREKIIFISIHCDAIYKSSIRGLMVYIPGANYYKGIEKLPKFGNKIDYSIYKEWREHQSRIYTTSERINIEARSRIFAQTLIKTAQKNKIKVHSNGSAIRNVIRKTKYNVYVPAVLRNTNVPTRVLIECANLANPSDLQNVADPEWRQKMAQTIAEALSSYFDS